MSDPSINVACPACDKKFKAPESFIGKRARCAACGAQFKIPLPGQKVDSYIPSGEPVKTKLAPPVALPISAQPQGLPAAQSAEMKACPFCGEEIRVIAKKCRHCNETIDPVLRAAEEAKRANSGPSGAPTIVVQNSASASAAAAASVEGSGYYRGEKSRITAALLAIFLGGCGMHKFYLGKAFQGFLYILLFCIAVSPFLGIIEGISYLAMSDRKFAELYG